MFFNVKLKLSTYMKVLLCVACKIAIFGVICWNSVKRQDATESWKTKLYDNKSSYRSQQYCILLIK